MNQYAFPLERQNQRRICDSTIKECVSMLPGCKEAKAKKLLEHFGSFKAIANANVEDFKEIKGIGSAQALALYQYFHKPFDHYDEK